MPQGALTEDIAIEAIRAFFREKPFLFFGTGMSCALDTRFGMPALKTALLDGMGDQILEAAQQTQWDTVRDALDNGADLESSLDAVTDQTLLQTITRLTGAFVASVDRAAALQIAQGGSTWPATPLIKRLVDTLPEGDRILHALTPNYDMLLEYACDHVGLPYTNGFVGGVQRSVDWAAVDRSMRQPQRVLHATRYRTVYKPRKHIRLYKVHGSLNYFFHDNAVVENNAWMWNPPPLAERVMITPGLSKYQTLQRYRQELLQSADNAIEKASCFLFLGYGFNDSHLQEYIQRKLIAQACNGLIVTRDCNPRIDAILAQAANLWIVCRSDEEGAEDTRVFNSQYDDWLSIPGHKLWDIGEFTTRILGG